MEWLAFFRDYCFTLVNWWAAVAGGILTVNEIAARFAGKSWEWPREHRVTAFIGVLLVAQIGAYKSLKDESASQLEAANDNVKLLRGELTIERNRAISPVVAENPDHATLVAEVSQLREASSVARDEIADLRSLIRTTASALETSRSQVIDLQQQLARAQQPPAVVIGSGGGTPVNQAKMNLITQMLEDGRTLQRAAPGAKAPDQDLKPWIDRVNQWYGETLATLKKSCTPQAAAVVQNRAGLSMNYPNVHSSREVQGTFSGLTIILGNLTNLLQRPEMCP